MIYVQTVVNVVSFLFIQDGGYSALFQTGSLSIVMHNPFKSDPQSISLEFI